MGGCRGGRVGRRYLQSEDLNGEANGGDDELSQDILVRDRRHGSEGEGVCNAGAPL